MQFAYVGSNVFVGNYQACDHAIKHCSRIIHIYHNSQPGFCNNYDKTKKHLQIEYLEGTYIEPHVIKQVYDFAAEDNVVPPLLYVHCAAGMARSPTFALICKVARGCNVFQAMGDIAKGMWKDYEIKVGPQFLTRPLTSIFNYLGDEVFEDKAAY